MNDPIERPRVRTDWGPFTGRWVVNIHAAPMGETFEVSVVREDNTHGQKSYGWEGAAKVILIEGIVGRRFMADFMPVFKAAAEKYAAHLNRKKEPK